MSTRKLNPLPELSKDFATRFWSKIAIGQPSDCWLWTGAQSNQGYGKCAVAVAKGRQVFMYSNRVAWRLSTGSDPYPLYVLHHCDNPPCCNPAHFFLGTNADNQIDLVVKGRATWAKLTVEMVAEIRSRVLAGQTQSSIASQFKVQQQTVADIVCGRNWKHCDRIAAAPTDNFPRRHQRLITFRSETRSLSEWARITKISFQALFGRLERGWDVESALSMPVAKTKRSRLR